MDTGILPAPALNEAESEQATTATAGQSPPDTPQSKRTVAPKKRSTPFLRHLIGIALALLTAAGVMGISSFIADAPKGGYSIGDIAEFVLSPRLILAFILGLSVLGFLNPGNWFKTPRNHVAKIYQPYGLRGSIQLIAFSLSERGWKPVMKRQGLGWVPFSIFVEIWYFPWPRVPSNQVGYIISNIGKPLPTGHRTAISMLLDDVEKSDGTIAISPYRDVRRFVEQEQGGEQGIQRTILTPSFFREIDPVGFTVITGDDNGIYGWLTDPDLRAKQEAGTLTWSDFGTFSAISSPQRVARLKHDIATLQAEREQPTLAPERQEQIGQRLVELQRELVQVDPFLPTVIGDDEQGQVTILDGETLLGGQLVHRFDAFKDLEAMVTQDGVQKIGTAQRKIQCYHKHIVKCREIKEALDRRAHLEQDIDEAKKRIANLEQERTNEGTGEARRAQIDNELAELNGAITRHNNELKDYQPEGKLDPEKLIEELGKRGEFDEFGEREAEEWKTLLNQKYNPIEDIFRTGRKFSMHLSEKMLKVALDSQLERHNSYQDLGKFFAQDGRQGPQWDPLKPGRYNHNKFVVQVKVVPLTVVKQGQVVVIKSDVGLTGEDITHRRFAFGTIVRPGFRGIWLAALPPGAYRFNTTFLHPIVVPTAMVTLFWGKGTKALTLPGEEAPLDTGLEPIKTITQDGYQDIMLDIDAQVIFPAEAAAIIIASFGSVRDLVHGVFSARLSAFTIEVVRSRKLEVLIERQLDVQEEIADKLKWEFGRLEIQVVAVLIQGIGGAKAYLDIREREINALREKDAVAAEAEVEESRKDQFQKAGEAERAWELAISKADKVIAKNTNEMVKSLLKELPELSGAAGDDLREGLARGVKLHYLRRAVGERGAALIQVVDQLTRSGQPIVPGVQVGEGGSLLEALIGDLMKEGGAVKDALEQYKRSLAERASRKKIAQPEPAPATPTTPAPAAGA